MTHVVSLAPREQVRGRGLVPRSSDSKTIASNRAPFAALLDSGRNTDIFHGSSTALPGILQKMNMGYFKDDMRSPLYTGNLPNAGPVIAGVGFTHPAHGESFMAGKNPGLPHYLSRRSGA